MPFLVFGAISPVISDGIVYASAMALLASGITLIYMSTRTFNFAHASMATWGLFIVYTGVSFLGGSPYYYLVPAFLFGGVLGAINYFFVTGPLLRRNANEVTLMMSTLGFELLLLSAVQIYADYLTKVFKLYPRLITLSEFDFEILGVKASMILSFTIAVGILVSLHLFLIKTKFGIALRATVENTDLAKAVGINAERVYLASWIIGGGLAALGGAIAALVVTGSPYMGWNLIVSMFAASILGGLYSVYGAILGGFIIGLAEYPGLYGLSGIMGTWVLAYRPVISLLIMVVVLLFFPQGLAGISFSEILKSIREKGLKQILVETYNRARSNVDYLIKKLSRGG